MSSTYGTQPDWSLTRVRLLPTFTQVAKKIQANGTRSLIRRIQFEFQSPQYAISYTLLRKFRQIFIAQARAGRQTRKRRPIRFVACYSLTELLTSFDFAYFLAGADAAARKEGFEAFHVALITRDTTSENEEHVDDHVRGVRNRQWRLHNIVIPLITIYPTCTGFSLVHDEHSLIDLTSGAHLYPEAYSWRYYPGLNYKRIFDDLVKHGYSGFIASEKAVEIVRLWLLAHNVELPLVTITIRDRKWDSGRNSNQAAWLAFADWLTDRGYDVVFVPDTDNAYSRGLEGQLQYKEAAWNLGLRLAIYEIADLNFGVNNGPMSLMHLSHSINYVQVFFTSGSPIIDEGLYYSKTLGVQIGDLRLPYARSGQIISWGADELTQLQQAFTLWKEDCEHHS